MAELPVASERYLTRVAEGLQALTPDEVQEVLAELRSHLTEAQADCQVDSTCDVDLRAQEAEVLAHFGSPDQLAMRILEERGVLNEGIVVPAPPMWIRVLAFATDVALGILGSMLALIIGTLVNNGTNAGLMKYRFYELIDLHFFSFLTWFLVVVVVAAIWWLQSRGRRRRATLGMRMVGLCRIRMGAGKRLVVKRDIPGMSLVRTPTGVLALRIVTALVLIGGVSWWFFTVAWSEVYVRPEADVRDSLVLAYSTDAISTVTQVYGLVLAGEPASTTQMFLVPGAEDALTALVKRHASGELDRYVIVSAYLPSGYDTLDVPGNQPRGRVEMLVMVEEYAQGSDRPYHL